MITTPPDLCIYHGPNAPDPGGCLDGHAAAWAVHQKWPSCQLFPGQYGDMSPPVDGLHVLIVDFSYPEEVLREMASVAASVTVYDHHKSAQEHVTRLGNNLAAQGDQPAQPAVIRSVFDLNRSGAGITWDEIWGRGRRPLLIEVCEDRDLWRFAHPDTKALTAVLASHPYDFKVWTRLAGEMEGGHKQVLVAEGNAIIRAREADIRALLKATTRRMVICGHDVPVANVPHFWASEAGNILAVGEPFAATYFDTEDGSRAFSLRSGPADMDVSAIAQQFGGGGHAHAAGFTIPGDGAMPELPPYGTEEIIPLNPTSGPIKLAEKAK